MIINTLHILCAIFLEVVRTIFYLQLAIPVLWVISPNASAMPHYKINILVDQLQSNTVES